MRLCHMGNILYRLGTKERMKEIETATGRQRRRGRHVRALQRSLKANGVDPRRTQIAYGRELHFDIDDERFVNDSQADAMLTREYRRPFIVPAAGRV